METKYEIITITENKEDSDKLFELVRDKAKLIDNVVIGQRNFAYYLKKKNSGFYNHILVSLLLEKIEEIDTLLKNSKECLRYLIVKTKRNDLKKEKNERLTEKPKTSEPEKSQPIKKEIKSNRPKEVVKVTIKKEPKKKIDKKSKEEIEISELDEKLKKLLEE